MKRETPFSTPTNNHNLSPSRLGPNGVWKSAVHHERGRARESERETEREREREREKQRERQRQRVAPCAFSIHE